LDRLGVEGDELQRGVQEDNTHSTFGRGHSLLLGKSFDAPDEIEFTLWTRAPVAMATLRRLVRASFFHRGASFREPMNFQCHLDAQVYNTLRNGDASAFARERESLKYSFCDTRNV